MTTQRINIESYIQLLPKPLIIPPSQKKEMRNILLGENVGSDDENGELKGVRAMLGDDYIVENDRDMNSAERDAVDRWKKRDGDFDDLLDQIGLVVDRLNPMAQQMGETAQKQSVIAQELTHKSEKAEDD